MEQLGTLMIYQHTRFVVYNETKIHRTRIFREDHISEERAIEIAREFMEENKHNSSCTYSYRFNFYRWL